MGGIGDRPLLSSTNLESFLRSSCKDGSYCPVAQRVQKMNNAKKIFCYFINYQTEEESSQFGPFEFLQERYGELIDENGDTIATKVDGMWMPDANAAFSDMVVTTC